MAEYAETARLEKRLTDNGVKLIANRNRDATTSNEEKEDTLGEGIRWAGNRIDAALMGQVDPEVARGQGVDVLSDICVDLAAAWCAGIGGREVPGSLTSASDNAEELLERFEQGARIPGLEYPTPANSEYTQRLPVWG